MAIMVPSPYGEPAVFEGVYFESELVGAEIVSIRMVPSDDSERPEIKWTLEYEGECGTCGAKNWILLGVDPGEYRCTKCVSWL